MISGNNKINSECHGKGCEYLCTGYIFVSIFNTFARISLWWIKFYCVQNLIQRLKLIMKPSYYLIWVFVCYTLEVIVSAHSVSGVQTLYQGCCLTQRNVQIWKPKQMRIWVSTENSRGPEIRPDGGRRDTSSFHAGFRLTDKGQSE